MLKNFIILDACDKVFLTRTSEIDKFVNLTIYSQCSWAKARKLGILEKIDSEIHGKHI